MEHPYLYIIKFLEWIGDKAHFVQLGKFAEDYPYVIYSWVVMLILIMFSLLAAKNVQMVPGKTQNVFEVIISGMENFIVDLTGEEGRWLFPILATVFLFIAASNLLGLIPGFLPPTANLNTTLSCALIVVVFTHIIGIKYHGPKYIKHFLGPVWWLAPLILCIELIGHLARVLSLSMRLFGNIVGHEIVLYILFFLGASFYLPILPLPIMVLGIFVSLVQAFVFFLLSILYFQGAMEHAH